MAGIVPYFSYERSASTGSTDQKHFLSLSIIIFFHYFTVKIPILSTSHLLPSPSPSCPRPVPPPSPVPNRHQPSFFVFKLNNISVAYNEFLINLRNYLLDGGIKENDEALNVLDDIEKNIGRVRSTYNRLGFKLTVEMLRGAITSEQKDRMTEQRRQALEPITTISNKVYFRRGDFCFISDSG
jgi:hypothetical protein